MDQKFQEVYATKEDVGWEEIIDVEVNRIAVYIHCFYGDVITNKGTWAWQQKDDLESH